MSLATTLQNAQQASAGAGAAGEDDASRMARMAGGLDAMAAAEAAALEAAAAAAPARALPGFVSAGVIQQGQEDKDKAAKVAEERAAAALRNPEEIDIDMGDEADGAAGEGGTGAEGEGEDKMDVTTKAVPSAVFGSLAAKAGGGGHDGEGGGEGEEALGALERFKKRRVQ